MSSKEIADAKKCLFATKDWDTFQAILRKCLRPQQGCCEKVRQTSFGPRV